MARREIGTRWDRENRNNINENFKELYNVQNRAIEEATQAVIDSAKLIWLEPVNTFADIATTYPNPEIGHTVFVRDTGKVYRFYDGDWMEIQQIDAGPVNEVDTRLSEEIGILDKQDIDIASIPRYSYTPSQTYDNLLAQMREEINKKTCVVVNRSSSLAYFEVNHRINQSGGDVKIRIEAKYNGNLTITAKQCDTVNWSGISAFSAPTMISDGVWEKTIPISSITKPFVGFGIQISASEPSTTFAIISKISMIQDGVELVNNDIFRLLDGASGMVTAGQINANYGYRYYLDPNVGNKVSAPRVVYVRPNGLNSGLGKTYEESISWEYFADTFYPAYKGITDYVILDSGTYRISNRKELLKIDTAEKMTFICPSGKAIFDCGEEKPTSSWTYIIGTDFVSVTYNPINHWNTDVKNGTVDPIITFLETGTRTRTKLTKVNSVEECQNTDGSYYYDFANKKFYINWKANESYYISIPEIQTGFRVEDGDAVITFVNIEVKAAEMYAYLINPASYRKGKISFYNCVGASSGISDDFHIQNMDTDLINCRSTMSGNDGFNFHYEGVSNLVNCEAWGAYNDGMSHHENCKGFVWNYRALHNGTSASTPAMGAFVYHENCYSEDNGFDNPRPYSGGYALLGGYNHDKTTAIYINCKSVNDERGFAGTILNDGGGNKGVIITHNCEVVNPVNSAYVTENGAEIKAIYAKGDRTISGNNINFVA